MKKFTLILCLIISSTVSSQEITLNHNIGTNIIDQIFNFSCTGGGVDWARVFVLEEFGVTGEYTITSGSFAIEDSNGAPGDGLTVNVYAIDEGFPDTFDESLLLGSSDLVDIPSFSSNTIFSFNFPTPIVIPADLDMILVEVSLPFQSQLVFIGGTMDSFDFSWFKTPLSCVSTDDLYQTTFDANRPDLNYYITVTGDHILGTEDINRASISVTPNPVTDKLAIDIPPHIQWDEISIFDISGKIILESDSIQILNVSDLPSGMYFIKIRTTQGLLSHKFIKQ